MRMDWGRWETRLGVAVAFLTILTSMIIAGSWVYAKVWSRPRLVVRERAYHSSEQGARFDLHFSVINPSESPIYVNELYFLEGSLTVGTGFGYSMTVPTYHDQVEIQAIWVDDRPTANFVTRRRSAAFAGSNGEFAYLPHRIFGPGRLRIEPEEQVDYRLAVSVTVPSTINVAKLRDPQVQAWLVVRWEDVSGKPSEFRSNANLTFW